MMFHEILYCLQEGFKTSKVDDLKTQLQLYKQEFDKNEVQNHVLFLEAQTTYTTQLQTHVQQLEKLYQEFHSNAHTKQGHFSQQAHASQETGLNNVIVPGFQTNHAIEEEIGANTKRLLDMQVL